MDLLLLHDDSHAEWKQATTFESARLWFWQSINFGPGSKSKTLVNGNAPSSAEVFERFYGHSVPQGMQSKISEQMGCRLVLAVRNQPAGAVSN